MIDAQDLLAWLRAAGIDFFTGVPDSLLAPFCAVLASLPEQEHVIACNEGSAVALALGDHLATGHIPLVYLQNSGIGNAINPLLSLASPPVFAVPIVLLVGWRGEPGVADEPQHRVQGGVMATLLETCCSGHLVLDATPAQAGEQIRQAVQWARERSGPVAVLVRKGTLRPGTARSGDATPSADRGPEAVPGGRTHGGADLTREAAVVRIAAHCAAVDVLVATTGMASRELFEHRVRSGGRHDLDFLTVGGMGHASQIALGIARRHPGRGVWCLDGDGALLMHLGGMATIGALAPPNLRHLVLDNGVHDSVGGQPTVAPGIDLVALARSLGYRYCKVVTNAEDLDTALAHCERDPGPAFVDVRVRPGHRADLGRPTLSPREQKRLLMRALQR
jgi:phosphonopyruvate decarboxylase